LVDLATGEDVDARSAAEPLGMAICRATICARSRSWAETPRPPGIRYPESRRPVWQR